MAGIFTILTLNGYAQYNWDYGMMAGVTTYMGDIGGPAPDPVKFQMGRANIGGGLYLRHKISHSISLKFNLAYIRISAADSLSELSGRQIRNLHFRNSIYEFSATPEIHLYQTKDFGRSGRYNTFFNTYLFGGVGFAYHNPQAQLDGKWVDLQPVQTENVNYSKLIPVFPVGVGAHFTFNRRLRIGAELGLRMTFFDYLDDVSDQYVSDAELAERSSEDDFIRLQNRINFQVIDDNPDEFPEGYREVGDNEGVRGNPESNDWYFFGSINVGYVIKGSSNFYKSRYSYTRGRKKKKRRSRAKF